MNRAARTFVAALLLVLPLMASTPGDAAAQGRGRGRGGGGAETPVLDTLSLEVKLHIRSYYESHPVGDVEALPPGIRRNLARGKPLPPGIAKKAAPEEVRSLAPLPEGFELVEVGLDVLLVEVATQVIHDVLKDVIGVASGP